MTKNELIEIVAKKVGLTKRAARQTIDTVFGLIGQNLSKGEKVVIQGFGTFRVRSRSGRRGRNPQTGAAIQIASHKTPGFSAGKALKKVIK
ncbi:HU family DNA-binding protein [Candidatus Daviesbacteria bacterium]|nr:HU family DNA-binding protein [Candidatus Daviesbacteria bacterium]